MSFVKETARKQSITPVAFAKSVFHQDCIADALFLDAARDNVVAFANLKYSAPICAHIISSPLLAGIIQKGHSYLFDGNHPEVCKVDENERKLSDSQISALKDIIHNILTSPGHINQDGEAVIDLKGYIVGTHYGVNLLLGDRSEYADCLQATPKAVLDHFGRGSFRGKQEKQVLATRYELSPEVNGEPANRQFYITENGKQIFYSCDVNTNCKSAVCVHSQNRTEITYITECGLQIKRIIFILPQKDNMPDAVEVQRIIITNLTKQKRDLRVVVTGMFGITDPGTLAGDIIYANVVVESELFYRDNKPVAIAPHHQPKDCNNEKRFAMLLVNGESMDEYSSSYYEFIGNGSLEKPEMVSRLSNSPIRRQAAFFAMAKSFTLDQETIIDEYVGMSSDTYDIQELFNQQLDTLYNACINAGYLTEVYNQLIEDNKKYYGYITMHNDDELLDSYINRNLPFQVLYQTYVSRSFAWTQKSYRETGFREIQDIFASMYYMHANNQDALIRRLITSWAENVFEFGYAYHNFTTRGKEPGMCSDDALWLLQAVYRYVTLTADTDFLYQQIKVAGSSQTRALIHTLNSIITYSGKISVGKHHIPLLDTADWNDCLRLDKNVLHGPEKEKAYYKQLKENNQPFGVAWENSQSESVMNGCLLKIAADHLSELADRVQETEIANNASEIAATVKKSIQENAWKENYYARCLINDNRGYEYLGSTNDGLSLDPSINGTYYLNSFSWTLLADIASKQQITSMLDIIDRYIVTDAGLKLVTPVDYDKLGIVTGSSFYFPGDRENGGVFKHAAMMATVAALQKAKTISDPVLSQRLKNLAFFMISKTLPYKTLENPYILKGNPRFCTQYNNSETCEGIGPILSGTASWLTLAVYEILGIELHGDYVKFNPILNRDHLNYCLNINNRKIDISIDATDSSTLTRNSSFIFDGKPIENRIPLLDDGMVHQLTIKL